MSRITSSLIIGINLPSDDLISVILAKNFSDKQIKEDLLKLGVDKKSLLYVVGTTLEYSGGLNGKGFVFTNPNANRTCGCGESFSL